MAGQSRQPWVASRVLSRVRAGLVGLFVGLMSLAGGAQACEQAWNMADLAQQRDVTQTLRREGQVVAQVPTDWVRQLVQIKRKIDQVSGIQPLFLLCSDREPNAFATIDQGQPIVALTLGMKALLGDDWDAYAAVLGHENAHLTLGHHQSTQTREVLIGVVQWLGSLALETFIQSNGGGAGWGSDLSALGGRLVASAYSRDSESDADEVGIRTSIAAGYDPYGAIRLHQKLNARGSFLSSHPGSDKRIEDLKQIIAQLKQPTPDR